MVTRFFGEIIVYDYGVVLLIFLPTQSSTVSLVESNDCKSGVGRSISGDDIRITQYSIVKPVITTLYSKSE